MATKLQRGYSLSDQLKMIVESRGLSPYALGQLAEVDPGVVSRWMNGKRDIRLETADKLALALGVRLTELARPIAPRKPQASVKPRARPAKPTIRPTRPEFATIGQSAESPPALVDHILEAEDMVETASQPCPLAEVVEPDDRPAPAATEGGEEGETGPSGAVSGPFSNPLSHNLAPPQPLACDEVASEVNSTAPPPSRPDSLQCVPSQVALREGIAGEIGRSLISVDADAAPPNPVLARLFGHARPDVERDV